jgi:hypothetical protein
MFATSHTPSTLTTVTYNDVGTCGTDTMLEVNWPDEHIKEPEPRRKSGKHTGSYGQKGCFGKKEKQ